MNENLTSWQVLICLFKQTLQGDQGTGEFRFNGNFSINMGRTLKDTYR